MLFNMSRKLLINMGIVPLINTAIIRIRTSLERGHLVNIIQFDLLGKVYKARDLQKQVSVAIKILNYNIFKDQYLKQSLKNEILVMKKLSNPHVVKIIDVLADTYDTELYIILEYCEGGDLRKLLEKHKRFNEQQATEIISQLLEGFHSMVNQGYIHRDIKPENCLIKNKVFKVADFGFATKIDITGVQHLRECVGTPLYMAPQLLEKQPYGAKSDIWSIGLMYYEMLCGKAPWPCFEMKAYLSSIRTCPLRFPFNLKISEEAKHFIRSCLTINENDRMGWDKIFTHALFHLKGSQKKDTQLIQDKLHHLRFTDNERHLLCTLQDRCQQVGKHPRDILTNHRNTYYSVEQFYKLFCQLDPNLSKVQTQQLFQKFDLSGDGKVSGEEFYMIFCEYDFSNVDDEARYIIIQLRTIIESLQLEVQDIFKNFDKDEQGRDKFISLTTGTLDLEEFKQFVRVVAPKLSTHLIAQLFLKFDTDHNGSISIGEFIEALQPSGVKGEQFNIAKANHVLKKFRDVVIGGQVDIIWLFKKYDLSGDGLMDQKEFSNMISKADKNLTNQEAKYLFDLFDIEHRGQISLKEFYNRLMF